MCTRVIDKNQKLLLSFGLGFSLGPGRKDFITSISQINNFSYYHPNTNAQFLKGLCMKAFGSNNNGQNVIPRRFSTALSNLKRANDIKIMKSDKGSAVVIMDVDIYTDKAMTLLNDTNTYTKLQNPPTIGDIQSKFNRDVKDIVSPLPSNNFKTEILNRLKVRLPSFCYFYGAPKIHKEGVPLRPIIATCGSPQSELAKWIANSLSPLLGKISGAHLIHSLDFVERLRELGPISGKLMSLDVTALFTNVPLDYVLENLRQVTEEGIFAPPIPIDEFCKLIKICVDATIFTFNGEFFQQKFGVAMGSPLSPILANLCMEFIEKNFIASLPDNIKPIIWVRYVDDVFVIYKEDETAFNEFINAVNGFLPTIKFTVEQEVDGNLPFLDVMVVHDKDTKQFSFKVYRKPTHTENYIHFYSQHSESVKRNVVVNMFLRAFKICDPIFINEEITHLFSTFEKIGYPLHFIKNCLSIARKKIYNPTPKRPFVRNNNITLPYSKELESISRTLEHINSQTKTEDSINISFSYNNTLRSRLVKNQNRDDSKDVGVYCIPCLDCNKSYIGESGRGLDVRLEEHKNACRLGKSYSAIATHTLDIGHRIGFSQSAVVYSCQDRNTRRTIEGALISLNNTFLNNKGSTKEDKYTNTLVCKKAGIKNMHNISATLRTAASPLYPQVSLAPTEDGTPDTGTYAENPTPPEPPDTENGPRNVIRRRSRRLNLI